MNINGINFTIGADPEVFLKNEQNALVSAHNIIPGSKKKPFKVKKGAVQPDGTAAEFNIDPASSATEFIENINTVIKQLGEMAPGMKISAQSVAEFGANYIESLPPIAKMLGCDPDYNAYTGKANPIPDASSDFRTGSGHIHIGWVSKDKPVDPFDPSHFEACCWLAQTLDAYLGIPSLIWDEDSKRRTLYGKAGCFRPKPYGMEYRTLSNEWLNRARTISCVFHNTEDAIRNLFNEPDVRNRLYMGKTAQQIINTTDIDTAMKVLKYENYIKPSIFYKTDKDVNLIGAA